MRDFTFHTDRRKEIGDCGKYSAEKYILAEEN
jgi:hypothetical protein